MTKLSIVILSLALLALVNTVCAAQIKITVGEGIITDEVGYSEADLNKTYLILPLKFENQGYGEFTCNASWGGVTVDNVRYGKAFIDGSLNASGYPTLAPMTLKNGSKINGYMGFEVPTGVSKYTFTYDLPPVYGSYNIVYEKAPVKSGKIR